MSSIPEKPEKIEPFPNYESGSCSSGSQILVKQANGSSLQTSGRNTPMTPCSQTTLESHSSHPFGMENEQVGMEFESVGKFYKGSRPSSRIQEYDQKIL
jgi:hypothetical protein